jgi:hypothetical protein
MINNHEPDLALPNQAENGPEGAHKLPTNFAKQTGTTRQDG